MTGLMAGPSRRYSYTGMGFRVTVYVGSAASGPKKIPSDIAWPESHIIRLQEVRAIERGGIGGQKRFLFGRMESDSGSTVRVDE